MSNLRFKALNIALNRTPKPFEVPARLSALYGNNVFSEHFMQEYLYQRGFYQMAGSRYFSYACRQGHRALSRRYADTAGMTTRVFLR